MAVSAPATLTLPAPAKLNLFLHVTGHRSDGYHTLETLLVPIDHCDRITLGLRAGSEIVRTRGPAGVSSEDDLTVRAARLLQRHCGVARGVAIDVEKRIPVGGGLGGGSSDAATVLVGLNRLWHLGLTHDALMALALELGADVPFFVFGEAALARGIGETLERVSVPPTWFAVLTPPVQVSTAAIFAAPELTRQTRSARIQVFSEAYGGNDLQTVAASRFPEIAACLDALSREVRGGVPVGMSGSGSSVFAAFAEEDAAVRTLSRAAHAVGGTGFVARALDHHPLQHFAAP
jgi:4-diphosphocytidyl-2-C-methyl-D-erythritol kinase